MNSVVARSTSPPGQPPSRRDPSEAQGSAHDLSHDLVGPAVDPLHPGVAPPPGDVVLLHVAVATVQLQTPVESGELQLRGPELRSGGSAAVNSPVFCASTHRSTYTCAIDTCVASSARVNRFAWKLPMGCPKALRSSPYASAVSSAYSALATATTAMDSRSCARFFIIRRSPLPGSPSTSASGTNTSSKNSSAVSCALRPIFSSLRPLVKPS